jgi:hypothetical protein
LVVSGLPKGLPDHIYILRALGRLAHEIWATTDPAHPASVSTVVTGLNRTHKNWRECDTGVAYLVADKKSEGWHTGQRLKIFGLGNPAARVYIRD